MLAGGGVERVEALHRDIRLEPLAVALAPEERDAAAHLHGRGGRVGVRMQTETGIYSEFP